MKLTDLVRYIIKIYGIKIIHIFYFLKHLREDFRRFWKERSKL